MAVTKGAMTSLPTSQTIFLPTVEEPENNRINFRDSLKFFQEQLVINGANFPSPASASRTGNDTLRKNGSRFSKDQNTDNGDKDSKDSDVFEGEIQTVRSSKISIPTVDTILESVRVLRAIQKSQEERGSVWKVDITSQTDIDSDFNLSDWIQVADISNDKYPKQENNMKQDESIVKDSVDINTVDPVTTEINGKINKDTNLDSSSALTITETNTVNEICSFWPSNTIANIEHISKDNIASDLNCTVELKDQTAEFHVHNKNTENSNIGESVQFSELEKQNDVMKIHEELEQNISNIDVLNDKRESGNLIHLQNHQAIITSKNGKSFDTQDSLNAVSREILTYVNEENAQEIVNSEQDSTIGILKIETYEDIDTQKQDDFLLNETVWKEDYSPNDSSSTKLENNDSDSGIGTQRSASSLSPNNPNQLQKDSWSDTCSSHYASAECSPYHSLNNVFDASMGLNASPSFSKECENAESPIPIHDSEWEVTKEESHQTATAVSDEQLLSLSPEQTESAKDSEWEVAKEESHQTTTAAPDVQLISLSPEQPESAKDSQDPILPEFHTDAHVTLNITESEIEQDREASFCFVSNFTLESPTFKASEEKFEDAISSSDLCDNLNELPKTVNGHKTESQEKQVCDTDQTKSIHADNYGPVDENIIEDSYDAERAQKFTAASCDLISIVESLYTIKESPAFQVLPSPDEKFTETLYILSEGAFCDQPEDNYLVTIEDSFLNITKDSRVLLSLNMKYGEVSVGMKNTLKVDNRMGRCVYIKCEFESLVNLKTEIELHCLKHWQTDCLQLVHYPLKCHQNVVIIDLGSCSTRAGILMDQPTLPSIFFPTICATDRTTGRSVYGMEALQPEVRQHSNLSFPVRPSVKITKHTIDIDLLEGLFKKIFNDLHVAPTDYTVQVCLPRKLSIPTQNALVKLLLESLKVKAVSLTNQALLTLYAHDVSTAVVVDIGDRTDVLPVVDGFIVETGVTKLPHGGQRLIHHMKHGLAEKRISLSNDIDSFLVQYIIENLAYVAEDYDNEIQIASQYPDVLKKTVTLPPASSESIACKSITLEEARFKISEGLFNPELWGLDSPGIHHLVQKAIQATSVDVRKRIAENIYVSGGVTMLPGFVERLNKEVTKLSKAKIVPKVFASNYSYHSTYIGACKFAKMDVFSQVCINLEEYSTSSASALKKCALYF